jgi:hypothetical protein
MKKRIIAVIVVVVIVLLVSIVAVEAYLQYTVAKNISISIIKVGVENIGITSATITLTLGFSNPSSTSLPPVQANFSAYLAGKNIGNGTLPQIHIVSNNVVQQTVSFNVTYATVALAAIHSLISGAYNITVTGKARVSLLASLVPVTIPFTLIEICQGLTNTQNCTQTYHIL